MYPTRILGMQPSRPLWKPLPKEEHSAHTISQRLRTLRKTPPELIPLGVVLAYAVLRDTYLKQTLTLDSVAVGAAAYSVGRKMYTDKQLRLSRTGGVSHRNEDEAAR